MKIAIIGAGNIGGTLGRHWIRAGRQVVFGVRNAGAVSGLVSELGSSASATSPVEAAETCECLVFAGPFGAWPDFAVSSAAALDGKAVFDASNPYPQRDGEIAVAATKSGQGSGSYVATLLPRAHVVKSFNTIHWVDLRDKAHTADPRLAMPIAGDDMSAVELAKRLASEAGFDPVVVGGLARSADLDPGSPIYAKSFTAAEVRKVLGLGA